MPTGTVPLIGQKVDLPVLENKRNSPGDSLAGRGAGGVVGAEVQIPIFQVKVFQATHRTINV